MISVLAHELSETATNPLGNAWYRDVDLAENGDLCAWDFGATFPSPNGAAANHMLNGRYYLLQSMWTNKDGGFCANQDDSRPPSTRPSTSPTATPTPSHAFPSAVPVPRNDLLRK